MRDQPQVRSLGVQTFDLTSTYDVITYVTGAQAVIQPANQPVYNIRHPALFDGQAPSQTRQFIVGPKVVFTNTRWNSLGTNLVRRRHNVPNTQLQSQPASQRIVRSNSQSSSSEYEDDIQVVWSRLRGQAHPAQ